VAGWLGAVKSSFHALVGELWKVAAAAFAILGAVIAIVLAAPGNHHFLGYGAVGSVVLMFAGSAIAAILWFVIRSGILARKRCYITDTQEQLNAELENIVAKAEHTLVATGSRSNNKPYLDILEHRLQQLPSLIHYRVMFGQPRKTLFREHIERLLTIRDPSARTFNRQTLYIGMITDDVPESFVVANETRGLILIPSLHEIGVIDSAVIVSEPKHVQYLLNSVYQLYGTSIKVETLAAAATLTVKT
jgi:hypothetical protein